MKNKIIAIMLSMVLIMLVGCSASKTAEQPSATQPEISINEACIDDIKAKGYLTVGCKTDVPGLSYYDAETDTFSGEEIDLAYAIAAKIFDTTVDEVKAKGYLNIVGVTVADREEKLKNGEIDLMIATYTITDERKAQFAISNAYYTDQIGIMVKSGNSDNESLGASSINTIADLDGKYIGVPRNATTRADFINYIETAGNINASPIFCEYESYPQLYDALMNGNIDAMAVDVSILYGYNTDATKILDARFASQSYGVAAQQQNQPLIDIANDVIAEM